MAYRRPTATTTTHQHHQHQHQNRHPSAGNVEVKEIILKKKTFDNSEIKEIDLNTRKNPSLSRQGICQGCGIPGASLRLATNEHLCLDCRNDINFKLITKTTALNKYQNITFKDLINNFKSKKIHCFFAKNWIDPSKDCIKLYYEKEIQKLNRNNEKHRTKSKSKTK
jgi:hypothetical protein